MMRKQDAMTATHHGVIPTPLLLTALLIICIVSPLNTRFLANAYNI
jgi:hypothetical protein